jgi:hypothetical protein
MSKKWKQYGLNNREDYLYSLYSLISCIKPALNRYETLYDELVVYIYKNSRYINEFN